MTPIYLVTVSIKNW